MPLELRPHQRDSLDALTQAFDAGAARATVEMATGTGKSYTQAELLCLHTPDGPCAAFVPSEQLLGQNAESYRLWARENGRPDPFIIGVSSSTAPKTRAAVDAMTTDPDRIRALLEEAKDAGRPTIVVCTYQSAGALEQARPDPFSLIVGDEAHRMASGEEDGAGGSWTKPLYDAHVPARRRAFFTATLRPEGSMEAESASVSMNNRALFGDLVYSLGYAAARDAGILAPITPEVVVLEAADVEAAMEAGGAGRREDETEGAFRSRRRTFAAALMMEGAVTRARADNGQASVLAMCPPGEGGAYADALARESARLLAPLGLTQVLSVHGQGDPEDEIRAVTLGNTPNQESVTAVVDKLREGTDMPALNALVVARPSKSPVLTIQALGRIARLTPQPWRDAGLPEKQARVYIPVIRDSRAADPLADGEALSSFLSAFLRMDEQALKRYQEAQQQDGRQDRRLEGAQADATAADDATASALAGMVDIGAASAQAQDLIAAIARQLGQEDGIGRQHRMMGRYLAHLDNGGEPEVQSPRARADDPERFVLAQWQKQITGAYAAGRLAPDEESLLETTAGFVFATAARPDLARGCAARFAQRHGRAPGPQDGTAATTLHHQMKTMARRAAQAKPGRMEGAAAWDAEAARWWEEGKALMAAPLWLASSTETDGTLLATGAFHRAPEGQGWCFQTAARAPWMGAGVQAGLDKPAAPVPVFAHTEIDEHLAALAGHRASYRFAATLDPSGAFVRFTPTADSLAEARAQRRKLHAEAAPASPQAKMVAHATRFAHSMGWPCPDQDLVLALGKPDATLPLPVERGAARPTLRQIARVIDGLRLDHAQGKMDPGSEHLLDSTPGFRWFTEKDWSRTISHQGQQRPMALVAAERVRERAGTAWGGDTAFQQGDGRTDAMLASLRIAHAKRLLVGRLAQGEPLDEVDRKRHAKLHAIVGSNPALFSEVYPDAKDGGERRKHLHALAKQGKEDHMQRKQKALDTLA